MQAAKRLKTDDTGRMDAVLFSSDVLSQTLPFLPAKYAGNLKLICKRFGIPREGGGGVSLADEAARKAFEQSATAEEKAQLPKYDDESHAELCFVHRVFLM